MTLIVDCVFAELDAPDAATASARVARALAAIGQPPPHGCEQGVPMPDPVPGRWGVELTFPDGTGVTTVAEAWVVAHALASELGPDARVQPCFAGTVARPGVESWVDADDAPQDVA